MGFIAFCSFVSLILSVVALLMAALASRKADRTSAPDQGRTPHNGPGRTPWTHGPQSN